MKRNRLIGIALLGLAGLALTGLTLTGPTLTGPTLTGNDALRPIHEAAAAGDLSGVSAALAGGADIEATNEHGATPLVVATLHRRWNVAARLVRLGANVNHEASLPGRLLTDQDAQLDPEATVPATPLLLAVFHGNAGFSRVLLLRGANPNMMSLGGMTPLLLAANQGASDLAKLLIEHGAHAGAATEDGDTPLHASTRTGDRELCIALLAAGADVNATNNAEESPLMIAVKAENFELVRLLAANGADLDVADDRGVTPLRAAIEIPNTELAELLGSLGAQVETSGANQNIDAAVSVEEVVEADSPTRHVRPLGIALSADGKHLVWSEYRANRIRKQTLGEGEPTTLAETPGPTGVAYDAQTDTVYWATDAHYPRSLQSRRGSEAPEILLAGRFLNRPRALTLGPSDRLFWSEVVAGRIRRAQRDGTRLADLLVSGLGVTDRAGSNVRHAGGIAIDESAGKLYWTELTTSSILRANLDGTEEEIVLDAAAGVEAPLGIAVDPANRHLYWADAGTESLRRANLDGTAIETVVDHRAGVLGPHALAIHLESRQLYWTDTATDTISRVGLDNGRIQRIATLRGRPGDPPETPCERAVEDHGAAYLTYGMKAWGTCLEKVGWIKAVKSEHDAAAAAAPSCHRELQRWDRRRANAETPLAAACEPAIAARQLERAHDELARSVLGDYPRAAEWTAEVAPFVREHGKAGDAAPAELAAMADAVIDRQRRPARTASALPASGQTSAYAARRRHDSAPKRVPDDGTLQSGQPMRFRDNGDGTISDVVTGLMWEKKCDCPGGLHHYGEQRRWSGSEPTIWDWLDDVNRENQTGLAGHSDWRIPNVKELLSIVSYERFNPSAPSAFDGDRCGLGCNDRRDPACSCVEMNATWTSTTLAADPSTAITVGFNIGLLAEMDKGENLPARAVRGGVRGGLLP